MNQTHPIRKESKNMPAPQTPVDQSVIDQTPGDPITALHIFYRDGANYKMSRDIALDRQLTEAEIQSLKAMEDADGMIDLSQTPFEDITNIFEDHSLNDDDHPFVTVTVWPAKVTYDADETAKVVVFDEFYRADAKPYCETLEDADQFLNCMGIATPAPAPILPDQSIDSNPRPASPSPTP